MKTGEIILLTLIVYISIIRISATNRYSDDSEDEYKQFLKLFGNNQKETIVHAGSSSSDEEKTYLPSDICIINPCKHGGICIPKRDMNYYCSCTSNYYGKHCEKYFSKYDMSKRELFSKFVNHMKRIDQKKSSDGKYKNDGKVYYDYLNGIYF